MKIFSIFKSVNDLEETITRVEKNLDRVIHRQTLQEKPFLVDEELSEDESESVKNCSVEWLGTVTGSKNYLRFSYFRTDDPCLKNAIETILDKIKCKV